ncbi:DUF927 domain-containing protein [Salmonella enterica]|nr:DUF927 domain-containing protein [Salmonella enterica]
MSANDNLEQPLQLPNGEITAAGKKAIIDAKAKSGRKNVASMQKARDEQDGLPPYIDFSSEGMKLRIEYNIKGEEHHRSELIIKNGQLRVIGQAVLPNGKWVRIAETQGAHQKATGDRTTLVIHNEDVHSNDLLRRLRGLNLNIRQYAKSHHAALGEYILSSDLYDDGGELVGELPYWEVASQPGWHGDHFVLPNGDILSPQDKSGKSAPHQIISDVRTGPETSDVSVSGTMESWCNNVGKLIQGNPCLMMAVALNLSAPMLKVCGVKAFGLHFYGESSKGKTTALLLGNSIYGDPITRKQTWNATTLAASTRANAANDMAVSFDELKQAKPGEFETMTYNLLNGQSRGQCNTDGTMREPMNWNTNLLSTGELTIQRHMELTLKVAPDAGQLVRLINILFEAPQQLHGQINGKAFAMHIEAMVKEHHGAFGRFWISSIVNNRAMVKKAYQEAAARWNALVNGDHGQTSRVTEYFAIMEAALKLACERLDLDRQDIEDTLYAMYQNWESAFTIDTRYTHEQSQVIERALNVMNNIGKFPPANIDRRLPLPMPGNWGYYDETRMRFHIFPNYFRELIAGNMDAAAAARTLADYGIAEGLRTNRDGKTVTKWSWQNVKGRQGDPRVYSYCLKLPEEIADEQDAN